MTSEFPRVGSIMSEFYFGLFKPVQHSQCLGKECFFQLRKDRPDLFGQTFFFYLLEMILYWNRDFENGEQDSWRLLEVGC